MLQRKFGLTCPDLFLLVSLLGEELGLGLFEVRGDCVINGRATSLDTSCSGQTGLATGIFHEQPQKGSKSLCTDTCVELSRLLFPLASFTTR